MTLRERHPVARLADPDDHTVLARIAAHDEPALAILFARHAGRMYRVAQAYGASPADAEALLHAVFLDLWTATLRYDPRCGAVGTWLCVEVRTRARQPTRPSRADEGGSP